MKLDKVGGVLKIVERKPIYNEICEAFHREMRLRPERSTTSERTPNGRSMKVELRSLEQQTSSPNGGITPVLPVGLTGRIDAIRAAGRRHDVIHGMGAVYMDDVPEENLSGLYYSGCD